MPYMWMRRKVMWWWDTLEIGERVPAARMPSRRRVRDWLATTTMVLVPAGLLVPFMGSLCADPARDWADRAMVPVSLVGPRRKTQCSWT